MNRDITTEDFRICKQQRILIKLKLDIYDLNDNYVNTIVGGVVNGNANINADSEVRRTSSLTIIPDWKSRTFVDEQGYIWIDKFVRISIGIVDERTEEPYWWKFGKFVFTNTNTTYDATNNQLTINCSDLMSNLDGSKNGELGQLSIVFPAYKEYNENSDDIYFGDKAVLTGNTYSISLADYNIYGSGDFFVFGIPTTNGDNPLFKINNLPAIPIIDRYTREPIMANRLIRGNVYSFFIDTDKLVLAMDQPVGSAVNYSQYQADGDATYSYKNMQPSLNFHFKNIQGEVPDYTIFRLKKDSLPSKDYFIGSNATVQLNNIIYPFLLYEEHELSAAGNPLSKNYYKVDTRYNFDDEEHLFFIVDTQTIISDINSPYKDPIKPNPYTAADIDYLSQYRYVVIAPETKFVPNTVVISGENPYIEAWTYEGIEYRNDPLIFYNDERNIPIPYLTIETENAYDIYITSRGVRYQLLPNDIVTCVIDKTFNYSTIFDENVVTLRINKVQTLPIVDSSGHQIDPSAIPNERRTYFFQVSPNGQTVSIIPLIPAEIDIPYGTPICYYEIRRAILQTATQLARLRPDDCMVDDVGEYLAFERYNPDYLKYREENPLWNNIPYDLEFSHGDTILTILQKLRDLYPNYEMYFDEDGYFHTKMIPSGDEDPIIIPQTYYNDTIISENTSMDLTTVRNICHAWGESLEPDYFSDEVTYKDNTDGTDISNYSKLIVTSYDAGKNIYECLTNDVDLIGGASTNPYNFLAHIKLPIIGTKPIDTGASEYTFKKYNYIYDDEGNIKTITEEEYLWDVFSKDDWYEYGDLDIITTKSVTNPYMAKIPYTDSPRFKIRVYDPRLIPVIDRTIKVNTSISYSFVKDQDYKLIINRYDWEPGYDFKITSVQPITIIDGSFGCIFATVSAYDAYMTGDVIALKMPDNIDKIGSFPQLKINELDKIDIYDENTYKKLENAELVPDETYCFKIKRKRLDGIDISAAYLLGSWQVQGIAALVDTKNPDPTDPKNHYITTGGVDVVRYSEEYFKEVYACPEVRLVAAPGNPFTCQKIGEVMSVYIDETNLTSDSLASARADYEVYLKARLLDSISVTTKLSPFADVNIKVQYKRSDNNEVGIYIVKEISHDLTNGTTTWQLMRFYPMYGKLYATHDELEDGYTHDDLSNFPHDNIGGENNNYVVIIRKDNGILSVSGSGQYDYGAVVEVSANPRTGYFFEYWSIEIGDVTLDSNNMFLMPMNDVILYAHSSSNRVVITYNSNGGGDAPNPTVHYYGYNSFLQDNGSMYKQDYIFVGWSETSDGLVRWEPNAESVTAFGYADFNPKNERTLYAVWEFSGLIPGLYETDTENLKYTWEELTTPGSQWPYFSAPISVENQIITDGRDYTEALQGDLIIPTYITGIDDDAFRGFNDGYPLITGVKIPDSVLSVGEYAFRECRNLQWVTLPSNETYQIIERSTFEGCQSLNEIYFPDNITTIGVESFRGTNSLKQIFIPSTISIIEDKAFYYSGVEEINCNARVIGEYAFLDCAALKTVRLSTSVIEIKEYAFSGDYHLTDVYYSGSYNQLMNLCDGDFDSRFGWNYPSLHCADGDYVYPYPDIV